MAKASAFSDFILSFAKTRVASAMSPTTSRVGTNCVIELITYELSGEH